MASAGRQGGQSAPVSLRNLFRSIGALGAAALVGMPATAAFLTDFPTTIKQPDGSNLKVLLSGDEYCNWVTDTEGFVILRDPDSGYCVYAARNGDGIVPTKAYVGRDNPRLRGISPRTLPSESFMRSVRTRRLASFKRDGPQNGSNIGTLNNIVIYIRFSDESEYSTSTATYDGMFNGANGTNSLRSYFTEASYGKLTINTTYYPTATGSTVISYQDSLPRSYYQPYDPYTNPAGYHNDDERTVREQTLLRDAVVAVSPQIPADLNVDSDGDGYVDNVCFVVDGSPGAWASLLWPHMWELYDVDVSINGKRVWTYNFQLEDVTLGNSTAATGGAGVLCHEMFHSLGAPDLYHYSSDGISPAGAWDLMCSNTNPPQHMSSYMKWKYGHWIDSIPTITTSGDYTLNPLMSATQNCYKIPSPVDPNEFFVVEYRRKAGTFESKLPGSGLVVWRVNTAVGDGDADGPPDEVYLYRQGGTLFSNGDVTAAAMYTGGRTQINGVTNPPCFLWNGAQGGLDCTVLGPGSGSTMPFHVTIQDTTKRLVFRTQPSEVKVGSAISPAPVVAVVDASGNVVTGYTGSVTVVPAPARTGVSLAGATTVSLVNGMATLSGLSLNKLGTSSLTASVPGLVPVDSASFNVVSDSCRGIASVRVGANPWGIAVNPITNRIYVSNTNSSSVSVLDGATNTRIAEVSGMYWPRGVAVNPSANRIYVVNQGSSTVSVIDGATNQVVNTLGVEAGPWGAAYNSQTNRLYVTNVSGGSVSVFDCSTDAPVTTIYGLSPRTMLAANESTNRIFTADSSALSIRAIAGDTNSLAGAFTGPAVPLGIAVDASLNRLYVGDTSLNQVDVFDGTTFASRSRITVGSFPYGLCANPTTGHVFAACRDTNDVVVIDGASEAVLTSVSDGTQPISIAVNPVTNRAYVSNWNSGTVSVIQDIPTGSPLHLEFLTQPGNASRGYALTSQPVVAVKNASGSIVTTYSGKVSLLVQPDSSGAALTGAATVDVVNGRGTFSGVAINKPGRYSLKAYSGAVASASSAAFRVTPSIADVIAAAKDAAGLIAAPSIDAAVYDIVPQQWPVNSIELRDVALLARLAAGLN